jgi:hypothetical protein
MEKFFIFFIFSFIIIVFTMPLQTFAGRHYGSTSHNKNYCTSCSRDNNGHIKRSREARKEFRHSNACPATGKTSGACPGYVIDHKQALKHGGADSPENMQWQTKDAAKEKDKWE